MKNSGSPAVSRHGREQFLCSRCGVGRILFDDNPVPLTLHDDLHMGGVLRMGDPQVTMGFNTKIVQFGMIRGTPTLGNLHTWAAQD